MDHPRILEPFSVGSQRDGTIFLDEDRETLRIAEFAAAYDAFLLLRRPQGAIVLTNPDKAKENDSATFIIQNSATKLNRGKTRNLEGSNLMRAPASALLLGEQWSGDDWTSVLVLAFFDFQNQEQKLKDARALLSRIQSDVPESFICNLISSKNNTDRLREDWQKVLDRELGPKEAEALIHRVKKDEPVAMRTVRKAAAED